MLESLNRLLAPALMQRLTLLLNHVLAGEQVAVDRLRPHAGRRIELTLQDWPALLPAPPRLAFGITPAGLLDWIGDAAPAAQAAPSSMDRSADLNLRIDAANPALLLSRAAVGKRPAVTIDGDATLATDVDWLMQNLRWDIAADLEPMIGPVATEQVQRIGQGLARGLRAALAGLEGFDRRRGTG